MHVTKLSIKSLFFIKKKRHTSKPLEKWGERYCDNLTDFNDMTSSIRFAGAPDGINWNTISFYTQKSYMGKEQYIFKDEEDLDYVRYDNFVFLCEVHLGSNILKKKEIGHLKVFIYCQH